MLTNLTALLLLGAASTLSFIFALAESSLFSLSTWQRSRLAEQAPRLQPFFEQLSSRSQDLLATIVLGNTVANAIIGGVAIIMVLQADWHPWITFSLVGFLLLIGCEVVPKTIAVRLPERSALALLRPVASLQLLLRPLYVVSQRTNNWILNTLIPSSVTPQSQTTDEDYEELVELGAQTGTIDEEEKEIILEIISLHKKTVAQVMTPHGQLATIPNNLSREEMLAAARQLHHTRLLIHHGSRNNIVGVLDAQALLLSPEATIDSLMEVPKFIPESMNLWTLLISFQKHRQRLAVVLDEFDGIAGIITIEDILEEIMGPIFEFQDDNSTHIEPMAPNRWRVQGTTTIQEFREFYPAIGEVEEIETIGGLFTAQLGYIPHSAVSTEFSGLRLTAQTISARRVEVLIVEAIPNKPPR